MLLPPAAVYWSRSLQNPAADARALEASLHRRHGNPLKLPGSGGWFTPVNVNTISHLAAVPLQQVLRGNRATPMWVYRVEIDGKTLINPLFIGRPGDRISLRFDNRIPQPSIVHWHGFINDARNDGGGTTLALPGSSHDYEWKIQNSAGVNWYHPHPHEKAGEQIWHGMSGLFLVEDEISARLARELNVEFGKTDIPLMIQDRTIRRTGEMDYVDVDMTRAASQLDKASRLAFETMCKTGNSGRFFHGVRGEEILVNMTRFPFVELPRRWVRFRLLNASNARIYRLQFQQQGKALPFFLLGADTGLLSEPGEVEEIFLAPAQRIDIAVNLRKADAGDVWLKTLPFNPMHNDTYATERMAVAAPQRQVHVHGLRGEGSEEAILRIDVKESDAGAGRLPHTIGITNAAINDEARTRDFFLDHDQAGKWRINGKTFHEMEDAFLVSAGTREIWNIHNDIASMPHPMHLHGFSFSILARKNSPAQLKPLVIDRHGRTAQDMAPSDTVLIWPGETVRIAIAFSLPYSSRQHYMFHCHNFEHEDMGMMLRFSVDPQRQPSASPPRDAPISQ